MQLDRNSAVILSFPRGRSCEASSPRRTDELDAGRLANLALMLVVLALAALWLIFPPAQLSATPHAASAQNLLQETAQR